MDNSIEDIHSKELILATLIPYYISATNGDGYILQQFIGKHQESYLFDFEQINFEARCEFERMLKDMCVLHDKNNFKPIYEKEVNNKKVLMYSVPGYTNEDICYNDEFVNKTKDTYLNIHGELELRVKVDVVYKDSFDISLPIDTSIYNSYNVKVINGLLIVTLYEIINKAPDFIETSL